MTWQIFFSGLALLFVFEGILPFLSPQQWRRMMYQVLGQTDRSLRIMGLVSMLIGLLILYLIRDAI